MNIGYKEDILNAHKQLHVLTIVDINQKLNIYDDVFHIDETHVYMQPIIRFLTNQNRHNIFSFLERVLGKYINNIVALKRCNLVTSYEIETRKAVIKDIDRFLENSKLGFLNLKQTYPHYKLLHSLLDNFTHKIKEYYINDFSP